MAKLSEFKNPIRAESVDVLSPSDWIRSIGYVAFLGATVAIGAKALLAADKVIPGNVTPNNLKNAVAEKQTASVVIY